MNIIKKHPFLFFYILIWACVCTCLAVSLSGHAESIRHYLENHFLNGYRTGGGFIGVHSGDSISYVYVSSGVTYYSDRNIAYYNSSGLGKNTPVYAVTFPFTPSSDGYLLVDDLVDGTMTDLQVYWIEETNPGDPDDPGPDDPDNPGGDVSGDDPGTDDPDNPSGPVFSEDFELYIQNSLYEIRIFLACILCVSILNIFIRRSRNGIA